MGVRKVPTGASSRFSPPTSEDWACTNGRVPESKGGCKDPAACPQALAKAEAEYAREITNLVDHANNRSLPLLMAGFEALDLLNIGLVVTTGTGRLLLANRLAEQILETRDGLEHTPNGMFQAMKGCCAGLSTLLQQAARTADAAKSREDAVVAVQRPSGKRSFTLLVRAVKRAPAERETKGGPSALVFILDPQLPVEAAEAELRQLFGLTSTEARLANLLMEGRTLDECCDQLGIRRSTGRTHLQHLFEKAGVQRQSELVSLLLKSIGLVRIGNQDRKRSAGDSGEGAQETFLKMIMNRTARATSLL